jgi:hypothetical protein
MIANGKQEIDADRKGTRLIDLSSPRLRLLPQRSDETSISKYLWCGGGSLNEETDAL